MKAATSDGGGGGSLEELVEALKRVGQQVRGAIYDLRLADNEQWPFAERIAALVERHRELTGFEIDLAVAERAPPGPVGPPGTEAVRIVAEALTNARRHSKAGGGAGRALGLIAPASASRSSTKGAASIPGPPERGWSACGSGPAYWEAVSRWRPRPAGALASSWSCRCSLPTGSEDEELRVLLVEDHATVREAIASAFASEPGIRVVGQAASLAEARSKLEQVDVAVVDLGLPDGYGGDLIRELSEVNPHAQALVLSASLDRAEVARAVESGAAGVLNKTVHLDEVVSNVRRLRAGEALLPMDEVVELLTYAVRRREQERDDRNALIRLTPRRSRSCSCSPRGSTAGRSRRSSTSPSGRSATTWRASSPSSGCTPSCRRSSSRCATTWCVSPDRDRCTRIRWKGTASGGRAG